MKTKELIEESIFAAETEEELLTIDLTVTVALNDKTITNTDATVLWNQIEMCAEGIFRDNL